MAVSNRLATREETFPGFSFRSFAPQWPFSKYIASCRLVFFPVKRIIDGKGLFYQFFQSGEGKKMTNHAYHVIPDRIKGGWNVYSIISPQEPQLHFATQEDAILYAEEVSLKEGVDYIVEEEEAPIGRES